MSDLLEERPELGLLHVAVPMWIHEIRTWTEQQRMDQAREDGQHIASHGDNLMFKSKPGASADAFTALARGLACAAYQPGGVNFGGGHWCTDHEACKAAAASTAGGPGSGAAG